jgi:hypothetical protein
MGSVIAPRAGRLQGHAGTADLLALGLVALAKLLLHLFTIRGYGIFRDEFYYLACAAHPDLGYVDHPPLSIWLLWLQTAALGDDVTMLRLLPAIVGAASVFVAGLLAREMGGGRGAQLLAALSVFAAPFLLAISHIYSLNAFEWLLWSLLAYVALRILGRGEDRGWLVFGALAGLALLNKLQVVVFAFGIVLGLVFTPSRRALARPWIWLGGGLTLLLFLPHVWWQVEHGWPTLEFIDVARVRKIHPAGPLEFFSGQLVLLNPITTPLWLLGLGALLFAGSLAPFRPLGWAFIATYAIFMIQQAKVYYVAPAYPVLLAAGSVTLSRLCERRGLRWGVPVAAGVLVFGLLAVIPGALPVLSQERLVAFLEGAGISEPRTENRERGALPPLFADMHGWPEVVETVAGVWQGLPERERSTAAIFTVSYGEAAAIDHLGPALGLPSALSGHNSYGIWGRGMYRGSTLVVVGYDREWLGRWFEDVREAARVRCRWCLPFVGKLRVWVCRGLRGPPEEFWARVRHYD